ncbi:MAG: glycosyltransferase [Proteobacteria bacterium]|nr:glycosyltransferase [Pseudomonadota bacterium]
METDIGSEVTVIIPCKHVCSLTRRAVGKIRDQYPDVPVVLLPDSLPEVDETDSHTRVLQSPTPILGGKRNYAVERTETPYVAFIDSDAFPDERWLENAVAQLKGDASIGIVGGPNVMDPESSRQEYFSWLACKSYLVSGGSVHEKVRSSSRWVDRLPSCNMIIPRELFLELEGFSTDVITGEDIELCIKVVDSGRRILFCEDVVVFHKTRSLKGFWLQRYVWGKSTFDVLRKTYPKYLSSILPFLFVSGLLVLAGLGALQPVFWQFLAAIVAAYLAVVAFEAWRVGGSLAEKLRVAPYLLVGNLAPGIGAVVAFFLGDSIRSYRYYTNED